MSASQPELPNSGANQPALPPPLNYDLGAMLKAHPRLLRMSQISQVNSSYLGLKLSARASLNFVAFGLFVQINCVNAVDYSIRQPNPALIMGAPLVEFHEQHPLLVEVSQVVPNTDGMDVYDPTVKSGLLQIDQSYVIAGQFLFSLEDVDGFKGVSGMGDQKRQEFTAALQRGLEWMEPFRVVKPKHFPSRTLGNAE